MPSISGSRRLALPTCLVIQVELGRDGHAVRLERTLEQAPQCRLEPDVVERRRSQLGDQALKLGDLGLDLADRLLGRASERRRDCLA